MSLVFRAILPLRCAPPLNVYSRMHFAARGRIKQECYTRLFAQVGRSAAPLPGRPLVLARRLSSKETDQDAGWTKVPLDCLKLDHQGLGYITDDAPSAVDVRCFWTKTKRGKGEVVIELWEDENHLLGKSRQLEQHRRTA